MKKTISCRLFPLALLFSILVFACGTRENSEYSKTKTEERVFVVDISKDSVKRKEYLAYHLHIWPEVEAGFKKAGYHKISLYRFDDLIVMVVVVPFGANLDSMGKVAESFDKRCADWNRIMSSYQSGVEGAKPGQTWVEAKEFYSFSQE